MASIKTFLSDQETAVDLISNEAIAQTIVTLICDRPDRPVTVGVHGDWGAGKSSILEMVEASLQGKDHLLCLKFNGWRFQGFEDAKIALIEGIVTELLEKRPLLSKASAEVQEVFKRIDWLKVAKKTGGLALTALTGIPDPTQVSSVVTSALKVFSGETKEHKDVDMAKGGLESLLKPKESRHVPHEIREFQKAFDGLLKAAKVDQLIVLIDDLDRCLPDTAIETLEAIRLFVFAPKTAFVVAADEAMIEYAVRKHFPDLPSSSGPQTYARNYLEKLIQVPFRIPSLGEIETRIYVALALAEAVLGQDSAEFQKLLQHGREVLQRPWLGATLDQKVVREAMGDKHDTTSDLLALSDRMGPILARGTSGNPRQVKRFLNTILLREHIADARGFGKDIQLAVLAKLLLAERFKPAFFDHLVLEASAQSTGKSKTLELLEAAKKAEEALIEGGKEGSKREVGSRSGSPAQNEDASRWAEDGWVSRWIALEPKLGDTDIRPYIFVANQQARMGLATALGPLLTIIDNLMGAEMAVAAMEQELKKLVAAEGEAIFSELATRIRQASLRGKPAGVDGMRVLVKSQPALQGELITFLETLPTDEIGAWVVAGWEGMLTTQQDRFRQLLQRWSGERENRSLSITAAQLLKPQEGKK